jgi:hypothetical protein
MNKEKAREFFSNYYEGTLEPGLSQALELAMSRDNSIREEYREFEDTYENLGQLKFETIEIPFGLNDKILANIDKHVFESKRNQQPAWTTWLRNFSIAGVAAVAVLGAFLSLRHGKSDTDTTGAGAFTGSGSAKEEMIIAPLTNHEASIHFAPNSTKVLSIHDGLNGPELRRNTVLEGKELETTLANSKPETTTFDLQVQNERKSTLIALPGSQPNATKVGQGNMEAFAMALAGYYKVPVEIRVTSPNVNLNWDFESPEAAKAAMATVDLQQYNVSRKDNGLIVISD